MVAAVVVALAFILSATALTITAAAQVRYQDSEGVWHWVDSRDKVPEQYRGRAIGQPTKPGAPSRDWEREGRDAARSAERRRSDAEWAEAVKLCSDRIKSAAPGFDAYVSNAGKVEMIGLASERYLFQRCMTEAGQSLERQALPLELRAPN